MSQKGLCHRLALDKGVNHARLPIDQHVDMKTRKVLTIDQVFAILSGVTVEGNTWKKVMMEVLPKRKGAKERDNYRWRQEFTKRVIHGKAQLAR